MAHATELTSRIMAIGSRMGVITRSLRRCHAFMAVVGRLRLKPSLWHGAGMNLCWQVMRAAFWHRHPSPGPQPQGHQTKQETKKKAAHLLIISEHLPPVQTQATRPWCWHPMNASNPRFKQRRAVGRDAAKIGLKQGGGGMPPALKHASAATKLPSKRPAPSRHPTRCGHGCLWPALCPAPRPIGQNC